jgi:hypothetical protein
MGSDKSNKYKREAMGSDKSNKYKGQAMGSDKRNKYKREAAVSVTFFVSYILLSV